MAMSVHSEKQKWNDMTFSNKLRYFVRNITVEPILLCYITPLALGVLAIQNLYLEKACRVKLGYSNEVCSALADRQTQNYTSEETAVQQAVAKMYMWKSFIHPVTSLVVIFLGCWSDNRRRRKPLMLIALFGELMCALGGMLSAFFFYEISLEWTVFLDAFFPMLVGSEKTMSMGVFSYIGDITLEKSRTLRIGIVNVFNLAGHPLGIALSGISYRAIGFQGVFGLSAVTFVVGFVYCLFNIKDVKAISIKQFDGNTVIESQIQNNVSVLKQEKSNFIFGNIKDIFCVSHIKDTINVVFKPRQYNYRLRLILLMIALHMVEGPGFGESSLMYLFMRFRFKWDEVQYSFYATYVAVIHIIGTVISVGLLSHFLKFDDALIGVISCMSRIMAGFLYAFAYSEWHAFLAPVLDILSGANAIIMKSMASKLVPPEELGKVYSLFGAFASFIPLLYGTLFAYIYANTLDTMPGAFFIIGGFLIIPAAIIFWWLYQQSKADRLRTAILQVKSSPVEDINNKNAESHSMPITNLVQSGAL